MSHPRRSVPLLGAAASVEARGLVRAIAQHRPDRVAQWLARGAPAQSSIIFFGRPTSLLAWSQREALHPAHAEIDGLLLAHGARRANPEPYAAASSWGGLGENAWAWRVRRHSEADVQAWLTAGADTLLPQHTHPKVWWDGVAMAIRAQRWALLHQWTDAHPSAFDGIGAHWGALPQVPAGGERPYTAVLGRWGLPLEAHIKGVFNFHWSTVEGLDWAIERIEALHPEPQRLALQTMALERWARHGHDQALREGARRWPQASQSPTILQQAWQRGQWSLAQGWLSRQEDQGIPLSWLDWVDAMDAVKTRWPEAQAAVGALEHQLIRRHCSPWAVDAQGTTGLHRLLQRWSETLTLTQSLPPESWCQAIVERVMPDDRPQLWDTPDATGKTPAQWLEECAARSASHESPWQQWLGARRHAAQLQMTLSGPSPTVARRPRM